jgi:hypothetical protein
VNITIFLLRLFGTVTTAIASYEWYRGGFFWTLTRAGSKIDIPAHLILILIGTFLLLAPELLLHLLAAIPPINKSKSFTAWVKRTTLTKKTPTNSGDLPEYIEAYVRTNNLIRWAIIFTIAGLSLTYLMFVQPNIIEHEVARVNFRTHTLGLIRLIDEAPLDFSSADLFRHQLFLAGPMIESMGRGTASAKLYKILTQLYDPSVTSSQLFESQLSHVYESEVRPYLNTEVGTLKESILAVPYTPQLEAMDAKIALLTLLAVLCNEQGDQGQFIRPYIQSRQLLNAALLLSPSSSGGLAFTHSTLGTNYANMLRSYSSYITLFSQNASSQKAIIEAIGETGSLQPLTLARLADQEYRLAYEGASANFPKARYLNNGSDLRISLLHQCHLRGVSLAGQGEADAEFLSKNVDPPPKAAGTDWKPESLNSILTKLHSDLDLALSLSKNPRIYFTRAQLYSLSGSLSEKYGSQYLGSPVELQGWGLHDLQTAADLGLNPHHFAPARASDLALDWLWKFDSIRPSLLRLSKNS